MKKLALTSLAGILAVSAAHAACISPYVSLKGGYSINNLSAKGDSLNLASIPGGEYANEMVLPFRPAVDAIDVRLQTNNIWSFNPAVGAKFAFDDVNFATFRLEAEYSMNSNAKKDISVAASELLPENIYFNGTARTYAVMANAYIDFKTGTIVTPFIMAGIGYSNINLEGSVRLYDMMEYEEVLYTSDAWRQSNLAWSVGGGLSFAATDHLNIDVEYRYVDYGKIAPEDLIDVKNIMHRFMAGVRYTF